MGMNETGKVLELLEVYETASGQKINKDKSSFFFSGNDIQYNRRAICQQLGMQEADESSTYLGLPNILGRKKSVILGYLKDRVKARIQSWKPMKLSRLAKEVLIKTSAQSLQVFAMDVFPIAYGYYKRNSEGVSIFLVEYNTVEHL
ncbi:uncharacterized protein LOC141665989 [Apium graveolens]|uniref:uncharacterized protein LOC141665989 n=1 Tax=Apium graveolens TaxID=4045 RepID=UPI003D7A60F6